MRTEGQNRSVERSIISELECCHFIASKLTAMQQVKKKQNENGNSDVPTNSHRIFETNSSFHLK